MRKIRIAIFSLAAVVVAGLLFFFTSGRFLIVNEPERADVIVVLAGEWDARPARALQLLHENYASKVILDVPGNVKIYDRSLLEIAQGYVDKLPEAKFISICPIFGLSTKTEAHDVARCLQPMGVHRVLVVTSEFHTRRARSIFRHELSNYEISVAAAYDARQFGVAWWENRQWAKIDFDEWIRTVWWQGVDRWR
jgi:uncharacterized SAM-binding protein YcdF (DUF218 family)